MPSGWVGVESLAPVCPRAARKRGWPLPPSPQACVPTTSVACSRLPVSSCLSLLGHRPWGGPAHPPALQVQPPQPWSLVVGEVPPEPDWPPGSQAASFQQVHFSELRSKFPQLERSQMWRGAGAGQGRGLGGAKPSPERQASPPPSPRLPSSQET